MCPIRGPAPRDVYKRQEQYARERRHLRPTSLAERMHNIAVFLDFLRTRGLESLETLQAEDLSAFVRTRTAWKPRTVACVSSTLRLFLQFLFMRDILCLLYTSRCV